MNTNTRTRKRKRKFPALPPLYSEQRIYYKKCQAKATKNWTRLTKKILSKRRKYETTLLRAPKAGTKVKTRDASTRHGLVVSYSYHHRPLLTVEDVEYRNSLLCVDDKICFWCKSNPKQDSDHAHAACSTTTSTYSWTNAMNIFPSCKLCNSKKGGLPLDKWLSKLKGQWSALQIETFRTWLYDNKSKLIFGQLDTDYVEKQFICINEFHRLAEYCVKKKRNMSDFVTMTTPFN